MGGKGGTLPPPTGKVRSGRRESRYLPALSF